MYCYGEILTRLYKNSCIRGHIRDVLTNVFIDRNSQVKGFDISMLSLKIIILDSKF